MAASDSGGWGTRSFDKLRMTLEGGGDLKRTCPLRRAPQDDTRGWAVGGNRLLARHAMVDQ